MSKVKKHLDPDWSQIGAYFKSHADLMEHLLSVGKGVPGSKIPWLQSQTLFEYGDLIGEVSLDDDQVANFVAEQGGQTRLILKEDVANQYDWDNQELRFNEDGEMTIRTRVLDNGLIQEDIYENGVRVAKRLTDDALEHSWWQITNFYDASGRYKKLTINDDGTSREDLFENGVRFKTTMVDIDDGQGGHNDWLQVESLYDSNGVLSHRTTVYDDGTERAETFVNGTRSEVVQTDPVDGTKNWQSIRTTYDANGDIMSRITLYDNGMERTDFLMEGVRSAVTFTDAPDFGGNSAYAWSDIIIFYDIEGSVASKGTTYDNGIFKTEDFANGLRTQIAEVDFNNVEQWAEIVRVFDDAGEVSSRHQRDDNDDATVVLYEDGVRDVRIERDGDSSETWAYRVTDYDMNGVVSVVKHDDVSSLSPDYAAYFEEDVMTFA